MYQPIDTLRKSLDFCSEFSFFARLGWWSFESWRDPAVHYAATLRFARGWWFFSVVFGFAALTSASSRLIIPLLAAIHPHLCEIVFVTRVTR